MTAKARQNYSSREAIQRWDEEGGASRSREHSPPMICPWNGQFASRLYYVNLRMGSGFVEDPEGETFPDDDSVFEAACARARHLVAEGDRKGENRRDWQFEITGREGQHVLTVTFSAALHPVCPR